ncbi:ABC transporter substrate-binding protein [Paenibacillus validus]|uniref:ABC transporter substrate-binding protein n=1 Tax=Paenibacillus validus TaxID=44253 RepID=UPI000FD86C3D|nr:ABC transporter substrate-binding protein [Paenibacillus validus]MED4602197.1 ABC transporter substrate-binding protein [Paenibacillus validus]MED4607494.1 ABC transporter substrate-binding protein [Paenibacillus validus]
MSRKHYLISIFLLLLLLGASGCGNTKSSSTVQNEPSNTNSSDSINIGVLVAETGASSSMGKPGSEAVKLIDDQLKKNGGMINGKKVEIHLQDFKSDDPTAILKLKDLISKEKIVAVVGATNLSGSSAVSTEAEKNKIPMVSLASLPNGYGHYIFGVVQKDIVIQSVIVDYLKKNNIKSVAFMHARDGFGQNGLKSFQELGKENNIDVVAVENFEVLASDMTVQLTKIKAKNPDAIIVWTRPPASGVIAKNYKQLGLSIPMIQSHATANQAFLDQVGTDGEGQLVVGSKLNTINQFPDSKQIKISKDFSEAFSKKYNYEPNVFSGYAYDGVQLVLDAISKGNDTPEKIRDYFENGIHNYPGITGTISFSKDDHSQVAPDGLALFRIQNQKWTLVK